MLAVTGDKRLILRLRYDIRDAPAPIDAERHESAASVKKGAKEHCGPRRMRHDNGE
jgi:hypothetical protein